MSHVLHKRTDGDVLSAPLLLPILYKFIYIYACTHTYYQVYSVGVITSKEGTQLLTQREILTIKTLWKSRSGSGTRLDFFQL